MFQYISDLLYLHDCLIVPGFGAFVGNPLPSELKENEFRITPPSKQIAFNINIRHNDGLLANYISRKEGVSYDVANKQILDFSESVKDRLKNGERVIFPQIGAFYADREGNLQFEPDRSLNYSGESFGLPAAQCIPIQPLQKETAAFTDRPALPAVPSRKTISWKKIAIVPVAALALWVSVSTLNRDKNTNYSFFNPFGFLSRKDVVKPEDKSPVKLPALAVKPAALSGETPEDSRYFVISGCFADYGHARRELDSLKARGYDARFVGMHKGFHVVSYRGYSSRSEAESALKVVHMQENQAAWVLNK